MSFAGFFVLCFVIIISSFLCLLAEFGLSRVAWGNRVWWHIISLSEFAQRDNSPNGTKHVLRALRSCVYGGTRHGGVWMMRAGWRLSMVLPEEIGCLNRCDVKLRAATEK
jgi:hypothetical protein